VQSWKVEKLERFNLQTFKPDGTASTNGKTRAIENIEDIISF
jgi:Tfp pilus assembly protein PilP